MTLKDFKDVMQLIDKADQRNSSMYDAGIDTFVYSDIYHDIISRLFKEIFSDEGWEWIAYYLYEIPMFKDEKEFYATRGDGSPIYLRNVEELYNYLKECGYGVFGTAV
ncbi:MAG: hypothetical protein KC414_06015 [Romboutsia sp.]|nr:hypothetical protein [Romboutsia sp.]